MLKTEPTPHSVEVADRFFTDADDLLSRYRLTFERDYARKSRRLKCYIDLRLAVECLLKGTLAYHFDPGADRQQVIEYVQRWQHKLDRLFGECAEHLPESLASGLPSVIADMGSLPIGLRYALDAYDFIEAREAVYYKTVGSDGWMKRLEELVSEFRENLNAKLQTHSGIIGVEALFERILNPPYNKYRKKRRGNVT